MGKKKHILWNKIIKLTEFNKFQLENIVSKCSVIMFVNFVSIIFVHLVSHSFDLQAWFP
jgi:hypothetical protein